MGWLAAARRAVSRSTASGGPSAKGDLGLAGGLRCARALSVGGGLDQLEADAPEVE
jgi:hypothetical protein